jgi:sugar phosphate isomerase/epimerase
MFKNLSPEALGVSGRQSEMIELALSFGFKGIDLDIIELAESAKSHGLPHARRLLDSAKLKFGGFALPVRWQEDDATYRTDLAKLPEYVDLAAQIGCTRCLATIAPANDERPYHQNFEFHRQRFNEIAGVLAPQSIRLGVGFSASADARHDKAVEFVHDLDALLLLLSTVAAKNVGIVVDLWDLHVSQGTLAPLRKGPPERIVAVRVADAGEPAADGSTEPARLLPGESGAIDTAAALVALAEMGYDGPVTPAPGPNTRGLRRDAYVKAAGERLDAAWKAAGLNAAGKLAVSASR